MTRLFHAVDTWDDIPEGAEVANLPRSNITWLGCFLLGMGLQVLADKTEGKDIAQRFTQQVHDKLDLGALKKYGIIPGTLKVYSNAKIIQSFMPNIRGGIQQIADDPSVTSDEIKFVRFASNFVKAPDKSEKYIDRVRKHAALVGPSFLNNVDKVLNRIGGKSASKSSSTIAALYTELADIVAEITGKKANPKNLSVPADDIKELRAGTNAELDLARRYADVRRRIGSAYDQAIASYFASSDGPVKVQDAYQHMEGLGFLSQKIPQAGRNVNLKVSLYGGKIKYYTNDGKPLSASIPANATEIKHARTYDSKAGTGAYLSYTSPQAAGFTRIYTEMHQNQSTENKFATAAKIDSSINKVLAKWKSGMKDTNPLKMMGATAAVMIYLTGMRVGSRQHTAASNTGKPTYGAISLRPRHVRIKGNSIILEYEGKAAGKTGLKQKHEIIVNDEMTRTLKNNLQALLQDKEKNDLVFSVKRGKTLDEMTYSDFAKYLKMSGYPAGIHKLRHVRGTNLLIEALEKHKDWKPSAKASTLEKKQKEAELFIVDKIITPVSIMLGHKSGTNATLWRTTIKSYINPTPVASWFMSHNLRIPSWLPRKTTAE